MTDPTGMLKKDHRTVKRLLRELASSDGSEQQRQLLEQIETELSLHMRMEEELVYPLVQRVMGNKVGSEPEVEHQLTREGLERCRQMMDAPGFGAAVDMLLGGLNHHIHEEETEILPALERRLRKAEWAEFERMMVERLEAEGRPVGRTRTSRPRAKPRATKKSAATSRTAAKSGAPSRTSGSSRTASGRSSGASRSGGGSSRTTGGASRSGTARSTSSRSGTTSRRSSTRSGGR